VAEAASSGLYPLSAVCSNNWTLRAHSSEGIRLQPDNADAHYNFGIALAQTGKLQNAAREFRATVDLRPSDVEARFNLGIALARLGPRDEAIVQLSGSPTD
jgi:Flp pilus assembly protein TadD